MRDERAVNKLGRLGAFRTGLYGCCGRWGDTLFEVTDAVSGAGGPVGLVAELMFTPVLPRGWGSVYQALEHGGIDAGAMRDLLAGQVQKVDGGPVLFAVDASAYPWPGTRFVPDVGMVYAGESAGVAQVVPGWVMQWVAQVGMDGLGAPADSWALPVDVRRISTAGSANEVAGEQIIELSARLAASGVGQVPVFLLDAGYCPIYLTQQLHASSAQAQILVRLRTDRVFFSAPPAPAPGQIGRPRKHGARFVLNEPATWGRPDAEFTEHLKSGGMVRARAWHGKHPEPRQRRKWAGIDPVEGTVIYREHTHPSGAVQTWWLWWAGPTGTFDLPVLAGAYEHRFSIEHTFRFIKQDLSWSGHTPINPDQAERWSWLIAAAHVQLHLPPTPGR